MLIASSLQKNRHFEAHIDRISCKRYENRSFKAADSKIRFGRLKIFQKFNERSRTSIVKRRIQMVQRIRCIVFKIRLIVLYK